MKPEKRKNWSESEQQKAFTLLVSSAELLRAVGDWNERHGFDGEGQALVLKYVELTNAFLKQISQTPKPSLKLVK